MNDVISGEQLSKLLHISKRKLKYLLENGYIPCKIGDSKTWRYIVDKKVAEQTRKNLEANPDYFRLPSGLFSSNGSRARKISKLYLKPSQLPVFRAWLTEECHAYPCALAMAQATELSHLSSNFILARIKQKEIFAAPVGTNFMISRRSLINFISSEGMLRTHAANGPFRELVARFQNAIRENQ